jgi:hypothetical protein
MAQTKSRTRNSRTPATSTTASTAVTPLSLTNSVEPETPDTSEPDVAPEKKTVAGATIVTRGARKRAAEDDADVNVLPKRRLIADAVVAGIPRVRAAKTKVRVLDLFLQKCD